MLRLVGGGGARSQRWNSYDEGMGRLEHVVCAAGKSGPEMRGTQSPEPSCPLGPCDPGTGPLQRDQATGRPERGSRRVARGNPDRHVGGRGGAGCAEGGVGYAGPGLRRRHGEDNRHPGEVAGGLAEVVLRNQSPGLFIESVVEDGNLRKSGISSGASHWPLHVVVS